MRESYKEDLANHFGLELYADGGNVMGVATTEVYAGKLLSSEITPTECRHCLRCGKAASQKEHRTGTPRPDSEPDS